MINCVIDVNYWKHLIGINREDSINVISSAYTSIGAHDVKPYNLFCDATIYWGITIVFILGAVLLYELMPEQWREQIWNATDKYLLKVLFVASWSLGFIVYCVGGYADGFGMLSVAFMATIHATEMFVGGSDISAVHENLFNNAFYMFMFGFSHFLAVFCSLLFIIRQIGFFFVAKIRVWFASLWGARKQNTFIFWGINNASLLMAEDIINESRSNPKKVGSFRIIFVRTQDDSDKDSEGFNPTNLYDKIKMRRKEYRRLRALHCMVVAGTQRLSLLNAKSETFILQKDLGLFSLCRIIKKKSDTSHILIIGNDADANIKATLNLTYDTTIKDKTNNVHIYCHSRKSAKTRSLEYYALTHQSENTEIHIIDTSHLSVSQLKMDVKYHPVQHVTINTDATIDAPFNAMIVGFGETGQEALRFLYEFGAFIGSDKKKSQFHCTVFDCQMTERKGLFESQTPFLETCKEISFCNDAINTPNYWGNIQQNIIEKLNYIIICPGNDQLALDAASDLCASAIKHRTTKSPRKLTICVRSYDSENSARLKDFCKDINEKYKVYGINVEPFGIVENLFTYDLIISDVLLQKAKMYNYNYSNDPNKNEKGKNIIWKESLGFKDSDAYCIDEIEEIERKREQNFCNALHGATKLHIIDQCSKRRDISDNIRENMARLEHERWVACMHINGWQRLDQPIVMNDGKLKTRLTTQKRHTDLCPWEEIRQWNPQDQVATQFYDYKVLDTTLELAMNSNKNNK